MAKDDAGGAGRTIALSPVTATVLVAVIGVLGTATGAYLQGRWNLELERQKFESEMILRGLENEDPRERAKYLAFLTKSGLLAPGRVQVNIDSLARQPEALPRVPPEQGRAADTRFDRASAREREGFVRLLQGDYDGAIEAFEEAERIYPRFHSVYEIATLLSEHRGELDDPAARRRVFARIVDEYAWEVPDDLLQRMSARLQRGLSDPP